jgi:hypothetical protein
VTKSAGAITSFKVNTSVSGKEVSGVLFKITKVQDDAPWYIDYAYFAKGLPRQPFAYVNVFKNEYLLSHLLDFGEADKQLPSIEDLRNYYRQAVRLLNTVNLAELK